MYKQTSPGSLSIFSKRPSGALGVLTIIIYGELFARVWVEPAGKDSNEGWQRWNMYALNVDGLPNEEADMNLLLLPTAPKIQESQPAEEVNLIRDEVANMVWGIETKFCYQTAAQNLVAKPRLN